MKTILFLFFISLAGNLNAQEENRNETNSYRFKTSADIYPATYDNGKREYKVEDTATRIFSKKKQIFEKLPESNGENASSKSKYYFFRIYNYSEKRDETKQSKNPKEDEAIVGTRTESLNIKYVYEENGDLKTFAILKTSFEQTTTPYYSRYAGVTAGLVTMPIKIRLSTDDYEPNINLGLNLGFKIRISKILKDSWQLQPTIGIGISDIPLNFKNSNLKPDEIQSRTAFTYSGGLLLNVTKSVNIGAFIGWDRLSKVNQEVEWKYQNKAWLGLGINVGFNTSSNEEPEKTNL